VEHYTGPLHCLARFASVGGVLLAGYLFASLGGNALDSWTRWQHAESLNLPGTYWLRLPPKDKGRLEVTVSQLTRNCQAVLMVPGLYSFSLWSGVPPVEQKRLNSWPFLWPEDVLNNELPNLQQQSRGCVLVSRKVYQFFRAFSASSNDAWLTEIQRTMTPIVAVQDITLYRFPKTGKLSVSSLMVDRVELRAPESADRPSTGDFFATDILNPPFSRVTVSPYLRKAGVDLQE